MKLLLDANISGRMVNRLKTHFRDCLHVDEIGLSVPVKDIDIWKYALLNNCIIITNDKDFLNLLIETAIPPKVVLIRTSNQSTGYLGGLIIKRADDFSALGNSKEYGFLDII
jgi:predicted nuclease of predicted toxin-antitoxin system